MKVLAFVNANSGVSFHRLILPLMLMPDTDVLCTNSKEKMFEFFDKGVDILYYNRVLQDAGIELINEWKEKYGFKICVDIDDFWELDEFHILNDEYKRTDFATKQIAHITNADVITTTHQRLAAEIHPYNINVHILPNAIPHHGQFAIEREKHYLTRLFWQGSDTHKADVEILKTPINLLAPYSRELKMIMAGYTPDHEHWHDMAMNYTAGCKHQHKLIPFAKVTEYYKAYAEADICLVPLVNSRFNRMKSPLKILEAANLSLPVIASAVHPYLDFPGVKHCKCSNDWVHWVKKFLKSRRAQRDAGAEIAEHALVHYNFQKINKERKQVLEYVSKKVGV